MPDLLRSWLDALLLLLQGSNATLLATGAVAILAASGLASRHKGNTLATLVVWVASGLILLPLAYIAVQFVRSQLQVGTYSVLATIVVMIVLAVLMTKGSEKIK